MTRFRDLRIRLPGTELHAWVRYITQDRHTTEGTVRRAHWVFSDRGLEPLRDVMPSLDVDIEDQCLSDDAQRETAR